MRFLALGVAVLWSGSVLAKPADLYLFYNAASENLAEISITKEETAKAFDDIYGPASDELPDKVRYEDFFVSKFPNGSYVFTLDAEFNCGRLGCATTVYERDADGDLIAGESSFPVKCKLHGTDKRLCIKGGYKVEKPKEEQKKRGPVHYPAPVEE